MCRPVAVKQWHLIIASKYIVANVWLLTVRQLVRLTYNLLKEEIFKLNT